MLTIGDQFPTYDLQGVTSNEMTGFKRFNTDSAKGKWQVYFFWPKDFTFICPTEIEEFGRLYGAFQDKNCVLYGISTDSEFVHMAWRNSHPGLKNLPYPMLSDIKRDLSLHLGVLHKAEGVCLRATFIVDPENIIRHVSVNDLQVGRNPEEILRILEALQDGGLMPCNWNPGQPALKVV
jgi:alkyl hydroperoxide reductase subunit AhpC